MNLLRNPVVTGALALVAIGLVFYRVVQPSWSRYAIAKGRTMATATAVTAPPVPATVARENPPAALTTPEATTNPTPLTSPRPVDRAYAERHLEEWADAPSRDPFLLIPVVPTRPVHQYPSPVTKWKLKAIWRQANVRVAAINDHVYSEGDSIEGYRIEKIDGDQVWFQGPDRMEPLRFNAPPAAASPGSSNRIPRS